MDTLLLQECLDELRSDDSVELTEAHNNRLKKKKRAAQTEYAHRHFGSSKPTSRKQPHRKPTTGIDSKTGQELASLAETIAQEGAKSPEDFLNELSTRCGRPMAVTDNTKYFTNTNTGVNLRLRLGNHRGSAEWFFVNGHPRNNFGIVIKMEQKRFVPDERVQYREEIFFKDDLDAEIEIGIVKGLMDWVATGRYTGLLGNETATSPDGRVVLNRNPRNRTAPNPQQPAPPPSAPSTTPPTGPDESTPVGESFAKYFRGYGNMKYKALKKAALQSLMEEDGGLESFMGKDPRQRQDSWGREFRKDLENRARAENRGLEGKKDEGNGIVSFEIPVTFDGQMALDKLLNKYWGTSNGSIRASRYFERTQTTEFHIGWHSRTENCTP